MEPMQLLNMIILPSKYLKLRYSSDSEYYLINNFPKFQLSETYHQSSMSVFYDGVSVNGRKKIHFFFLHRFSENSRIFFAVFEKRWRKKNLLFLEKRWRKKYIFFF